MKTYGDFNEFCKSSGLCTSAFHLMRSHGLEACNELGTFSPRRLPELIEFCKKNPDFHIVTYISTAEIVNYVAPDNASKYALARGERDPEITFIRSAEDLEAMWREVIVALTERARKRQQH